MFKWQGIVIKSLCDAIVSLSHMVSNHSADFVGALGDFSLKTAILISLRGFVPGNESKAR